MGKAIRTVSWEFNYTVFVELFTTHFSKKNQDFIIYPSRNKNITNMMGHSMSYGEKFGILYFDGKVHNYFIPKHSSDNQ